MEIAIGVAGIVVAVISVIIAYIQLRRTPKSTPSISSELNSFSKDKVIEFKEKFEAFVKRLEVEWRSEKASQPVKITNGKLIFARAGHNLVDFQVTVPDSLVANFSPILDEAIRRAKMIQDHDVFIDGGRSYRAFWEEGDAIIGILKNIDGQKHQNVP